MIRNKAISIVNGNKFNDSDRKQLGHSFDNLLFSCYFGDKMCNASDFDWIYDSFYGNCFVFNSFNSSSKLKKSSISGYFYGLQLELYAGFHENLTLFNSPYGSNSLIIQIGNSSYMSESYSGIR